MPALPGEARCLVIGDRGFKNIILVGMVSHAPGNLWGQTVDLETCGDACDQRQSCCSPDKARHAICCAVEPLSTLSVSRKLLKLWFFCTVNVCEIPCLRDPHFGNGKGLFGWVRGVDLNVGL